MYILYVLYHGFVSQWGARLPSPSCQGSARLPHVASGVSLSISKRFHPTIHFLIFPHLLPRLVHLYAVQFIHRPICV